MADRRRGANEKEKAEELYERANLAMEQSIPAENRAKTLLEIYFLEDSGRSLI